MKHQARRIALEALVKIEQGGAYSNLLLNQLFKQHTDLDPRDRNLITEIVYGSIQHQRLIDFYLQPLIKKNLDQLEQWVKQLLRLSMYQLLFLDRVPERAVVHEAVEISKILGHRGITGMVNGILRNFLRSPRASFENIKDPVERLAVKTSHPTWLVRRWVNQFGLETTTSICEENNRPAKITIRVNSLKGTREQVKELLIQEGFEVEETSQAQDGLRILSGGNVAQTSLFQEGFITIQDESSMLIAPLLDPKPGMKVLDACAAPGGKTTHLAEYMENEGQLIAVDLHPHKEKLVQASVKRLGTTIVQTMVADARKLNDQLTPEFDRILLDAPCSGFGVIRRKPDVKWKKDEADIAHIADVQVGLLSKVSSLLKDKGQLVYSTCTLDKEENQGVIDRFLSEHPHFSVVEGSAQQILPHHFGSDGFFMIKLIRKG
jgi:16S rRNA (cytosine967-C5)-methyltransferase